MVVRRDYSEDAVSAVKSVLLELVRLLGEYRDDVVIVGGWVPELLLPAGPARHVGSIDVDLALNHRTLQDTGYKTITRLLADRGYRQDREQPFIFRRAVPVGDREITVEVDLLAGEYGGSGRSHRTQKIQDARARKTRGCDLAFDMSTEVTIRGTLPDGGEDSASIRVASIVPFLVMKGMALHDRMKEKDAWDIYYCLRNYPGGLDVLAGEFVPHIGHGLVKEGLRKVADKFQSPDYVGPRWVADFEEIIDPDERAITQRRAYESVRYLLVSLEALGVDGTTGDRIVGQEDGNHGREKQDCG